MISRETIDQIARTPQSQILWLALALTAIRFLVQPVLWRTKPHLRGSGYRFARFLNEACDSLVYAAILIFFVVRPFAFQTFTIPSGSMVPTLLVNDYVGINKAIYRYTDPKRFDIVVFRPPLLAARPEQVDASGNVKVDFVKRLIGLPGDVVEIREGTLFVNGARLEQPWVRTMRNVAGSQTLYEDLPAEDVATLPRASFKLVQDGGKLIPLNWTRFDVNAMSPSSGVYGVQPYNIHPSFAVFDAAEGERLRRLPPARLPAGMYLFMGDNRLNSADGRNWGLVPRNSIVGRAEFIWWPFSRWRGLR